MVYETILTSGLPRTVGATAAGGVKLMIASVFDPCASRYDPAMQRTVRALAENMGITLEELPFSGEEARCCSWGGQSFTADTSLAGAITANHTEAGDKPYLTYCTNCRDILSASGKHCLHIFDLLFGLDMDLRLAPTATIRRRNRIELKQTLIGKYGDACMDTDGSAHTEEKAETEKAPVRLLMDERLARQMSDDLILEEDIAEVIRHCEETGRKLIDGKTGFITGYLKQGVITYWAEYVPEYEASCYTLIRAYSHRLVIDDE